jgi:ribosome-binding protein aMBF1 (putative translation factor)
MLASLACSAVDFIARRTAMNPEFPMLMKAAIETRRLVLQLAAERERLGLSQEKVAAALGTKQPNVARLESGAVDPKHTTLVRYAGLLGRRITLQPKSGHSRSEHHGRPAARAPTDFM